MEEFDRVVFFCIPFRFGITIGPSYSRLLSKTCQSISYAQTYRVCIWSSVGGSEGDCWWRDGLCQWVDRIIPRVIRAEELKLTDTTSGGGWGRKDRNMKGFGLFRSSGRHKNWPLLSPISLSLKNSNYSFVGKAQGPFAKLDFPFVTLHLISFPFQKREVPRPSPTRENDDSGLVEEGMEGIYVDIAEIKIGGIDGASE